MLKRTITSGALAVLGLIAQGPPPNRPLTPADQPDAQTLSRTVQALRRSAQLPPTAVAAADTLLATAADMLHFNQTGEARRKLANAQALVTGKPSDAQQEWVWSLEMRPQRLVVEQSQPKTIELAKG